MKKTSIFTFTIVFLLGAVIPAPGVFAIKTQTERTKKSAQEQTNFIPIKVISASSATKVSVVKNQQFEATSACVMTVGQSGNLVQKTGTINLNQPANCFALDLAAPQSFRQLAVVGNSGLQTQIVVKRFPVEIAVPNFSQGSAAQNIPLVPLTASVLAISLFMRKRRLQFLNFNFVSELKRTLTPLELQVLRC